MYLKKKKEKIVLPSPEGPIRENNIQRVIITTVPKQRRWVRGIGSLIVPRLDDWPVHAIKHQLQVRHLTRVPP